MSSCSTARIHGATDTWNHVGILPAPGDRAATSACPSAARHPAKTQHLHASAGPGPRNEPRDHPRPCPLHIPSTARRLPAACRRRGAAGVGSLARGECVPARTAIDSFQLEGAPATSWPLPLSSCPHTAPAVFESRVCTVSVTAQADSIRGPWMVTTRAPVPAQGAIGPPRWRRDGRSCRWSAGHCLLLSLGRSRLPVCSWTTSGRRHIRAARPTGTAT